MSDVIINISDYRQKRGVKFFFRLLFHLVAIIIYFSVSLYAAYLWYRLIMSDFDDLNFTNLKWFTPGYVTNWNFTFQTCFLVMSLVYDMLEWTDKHESPIARRLKYCRDIFFSGLVVPLTMFIATFFWIIYWIDRELVFPQIYDQLVPWWFNHCVHTNILIVIGLETILQTRRYPANRKVELFLTGIAGVAYAIVYYLIYFLAHRWLYGVFGTMNWWQVCLFQIVIWIYMFLVYFVQFPINRIFHREVSEIKEEKTGISNTEDRVPSNTSIPDNWNSKIGYQYQTESSAL